MSPTGTPVPRSYFIHGLVQLTIDGIIGGSTAHPLLFIMGGKQHGALGVGLGLDHGHDRGNSSPTWHLALNSMPGCLGDARRTSEAPVGEQNVDQPKN